jgi:hypothetical protein
MNMKCSSVVATAVACVASRDCPVGQICITYASGLPNAPARKECRTNPCASTVAPTCDCAASVCQDFGAGICSVMDGELICRDGFR